MATPFGGHAGEVCQSAGIYRSEYGENSRLIIEEGRHFPSDGGYWSKIDNYPDTQAMAGEHARQQFWAAFS